VNLLVTDPSGQQAGFTSDGSEVDQIPGAALIGPCSPITDNIVSVTIPYPLAGAYSVQAFPSCASTSGSPYTIEIQNANGSQTYSGIVYLGGSSQTTFVSIASSGQISITTPIPTPIHIPSYHPSITIVLSSSTITAGGSITAAATLTGASPTAGGTVTYWYSPGSTCSGPYYVVGSPVTVTDGIVPNSQPQNFSKAGSYSWIAAYSGDYNDQGAESACESLTVTDPVPSLSTTLSQTIIGVGQSVTGSATLTGVLNAGGTVTYEYFSGSTCSGAPTTVGSPVTVTDGGVPNSAPQAFSTPGYYSWNAVYSGDANNLGATGGCRTLTVNASPMTFTLSCSHASVAVGATVTCKAKVVGSGSAPTGGVVWSTDSAGTLSSTSCTLSKHKSYSTCSVKFTPTVAGSSVVLTASYGGDSKNFPSAGTYSLTVTTKATKTTVSCTPKSAVAGSSMIVTCTAKVTGYSPTGMVSWFQSGTGSVSLTSTECTLSQGTCSVTMTGTTAGKVTLQATYSGDLNNRGSSGTAKLTIKKA
jgi:hypothetical protein